MRTDANTIAVREKSAIKTALRADLERRLVAYLSDPVSTGDLRRRFCLTAKVMTDILERLRASGLIVSRQVSGKQTDRAYHFHVRAEHAQKLEGLG